MSNKSDSRSVATDALDTLGTVLTGPQKRDAIHLAVVPMTAQSYLAPGTHLDKTGLPTEPNGPDAVGIVDPFLLQPVKKGESFWCVIYPRVITSLRHVWTHPAFEDEVEVNRAAKVTSQKDDSKMWLQAFAAQHGISYGTLIESLEHYDGDYEYLTILGEDAHGSFDPAFWYHAEKVTGVKGRATYFSCSC